MYYQALYRKYRPTTFEDVFGQDFIIKTLKNAVKEKKVAHAYLFCGPRGIGKTTVARLLAKAVNCTDQKDGNPCGICLSCKQIANKATSDIIEIDAASNNGVDEIREIRSKVNLVPTECKYKVYIIDEVHMLSTGAFNALLKTLEEPPNHVIFILATTEAYKLPMTIVSRCQQFDFKKIANKKIEAKLKMIVEKEKIKIGPDAIKEIARLADGSLRDAEGLLDKLIAFTNNNIKSEDVYIVDGTISKEQTVAWLGYILDGDAENILKVIDELNDKGKDLFKIIEDILLFLRDMIIFKKAPSYFNEDKELLDFYQNLNLKVDENDIYKLIMDLNNTYNEMKISNNPRILLEIALLNFNLKESLKSNEIAVIEEEKQVVLKETKPQLKTKEKEKVIDIKQIRINNVLVKADKKALKDLKTKWHMIDSFLVDPDIGQIAGLLIDTEIGAAGEGVMLITYKHDSLVNRINKNLKKTEAAINQILGQSYKIIAVTESEWKDIKNTYIEKKSKGEKYTIIEEPDFEEEDESGEFLKMTLDLFGENIVEIN